MCDKFGVLPNGKTASLYTIQSGKMTAVFSDMGATLVKLFVPDRDGKLADVVLGFDDPKQYWDSTTFFGAVVGRNCTAARIFSRTAFGKCSGRKRMPSPLAWKVLTATRVSPAMPRSG